MAYLVYIKNPGGGLPSPQLWQEDLTKGTGEFQHKPVGHPESRLVSFRELSDQDAGRPLGWLAGEYPCVEGQVMFLSSRSTTIARPRQQFGHRVLRDANCARQLEWDREGKIDLSFRGTELGGEVGEALNVLKKLQRERMGIGGSRATPRDLADELADCVICLDLTAITAGVPLSMTRPMFEAQRCSLTLLGCQLLTSLGRVTGAIVEIETTRSDQDRRVSLGLRLDDCLAVVKRVALEAGVVLAVAVPRKFNETSAKYGLSTRMEEQMGEDR